MNAEEKEDMARYDLDRQLLGRALAGLVPAGAEWGQLRWADVLAYCRLQDRRSR